MQVTWRHDAPDGQPGARTFAGLAPGHDAPADDRRARHHGRGHDAPAAPGRRALPLRDAQRHPHRLHLLRLPRPDATRPPAPEPHAVRCLRSAVDDALAWGAAAHRQGRRHPPQRSSRSGARSAGCWPACRAGARVVPGNHDVHGRRDGRPAAGAGPQRAPPRPRRRGDGRARRSHPPRRHRRPRRQPRSHRAVQDEIGSARTRAGAVVIALHHHIEHHQLPTYLPAASPPRRAAPSWTSSRPPTRAFVTTGHSHRYRRHDRAGAVERGRLPRRTSPAAGPATSSTRAASVRWCAA